MPAYLITYDLDKPGQDYSNLIAALTRASAVRVLYSTWVLDSTSTAAELRDHYRQHIDANDRLFVTDANAWASWNMMNRDEAKKILP